MEWGRWHSLTLVAVLEYQVVAHPRFEVVVQLHDVGAIELLHDLHFGLYVLGKHLSADHSLLDDLHRVDLALFLDLLVEGVQRGLRYSEYKRLQSEGFRVPTHSGWNSSFRFHFVSFTVRRRREESE